jgi:hypothetical protein
MRSEKLDVMGSRAVDVLPSAQMTLTFQNHDDAAATLAHHARYCTHEQARWLTLGL